jgi:hypothetical protein
MAKMSLIAPQNMKTSDLGLPKDKEQLRIFLSGQRIHSSDMTLSSLSPYLFNNFPSYLTSKMRRQPGVTTHTYM